MFVKFFSISKIVFNILHMHCLLVFTFKIHFDFSLLAGKIFHSLFDEITIHGNVKITFHYDSAHVLPHGV